jgi:hypothetical protein
VVALRGHPGPFHPDRLGRFAGSGQPGRRLEKQRVDEGLRYVAAQLPLRDVEFLGQQGGRPAGGAVALEPAGCLSYAALLVQGPSHEEPAQYERALGLVQWPLIVPEPVEVAVLGQVAGYRLSGGPGTAYSRRTCGGNCLSRH